MADKQHTQTHPKFTWLFLATLKSHPDCSPVVLRFDTDTEENARAAFPGWEMVFAAKIRAEAPCRVAFFDYNTRRGWAFDSASDGRWLAMINTYRTKSDLLTLAQEVAALLSCASYLATIRGMKNVSM